MSATWDTEQGRAEHACDTRVSVSILKACYLSSIERSLEQYATDHQPMHLMDVIAAEGALDALRQVESGLVGEMVEALSQEGGDDD